jgi:hypothetical protein
VKLSSVAANADKKKQQNFILRLLGKVTELVGYAIQQICNMHETVLFWGKKSVIEPTFPKKKSNGWIRSRDM